MDDIRILVAIDFETIYSGNVIRPRSEVLEEESGEILDDTEHPRPVELFNSNEEINSRNSKKKGQCPTVKFPQQVDFVLTISAEWRIKSLYLFETFEHQVPIIAAVPALSMPAIVRGAIKYGFNIDIVHDRMLKWTHGIEVADDKKKGWNVIFIFMNLQTW
ncbi:hypothetical protein RhiirB3_453142 [Rhizophagus irregularis]|nr:hypothetical protein RhiirB3_453142 [Rhizophagus irregularis]